MLKKKTTNQLFAEELAALVKQCQKAKETLTQRLEKHNKYTLNLEMALDDTITISEDLVKRLAKAPPSKKMVEVKTVPADLEL